MGIIQIYKYKSKDDHPSNLYIKVRMGIAFYYFFFKTIFFHFEKLKKKFFVLKQNKKKTDKTEKKSLSVSKRKTEKNRFSFKHEKINKKTLSMLSFVQNLFSL